ncbi:MAG TPA: DUF983 domain-containing protein, partial [Opitutus sp.]|nr:DUF983 domain-containing protein [Opitutus sp.]
MHVTRLQVIRRGLSHRCPNCGEPTLFPPKSLQIHRRCPVCGVGLDRGDGFFLGPWVLNYTVVVFCLVPIVVLSVRGIIPWVASLVLAGIGC